MGRSGVKALPSPRSYKPFWSSDDKIDTTKGKRRLDLPQNRQETSSGASAATDGGSPFRERIVYSCWGEIVFLRLGVSSFSSLDLEIVFLRIKSVFLGRKVYS